MLIYNESYENELNRAIEAINEIDRLNKKKVLITGGNGLVCSHVVDLLHVLNKKHGAGIEILLAGRNKDRFAKRFHYLSEGKDYTFIPFDAATVESLDCDADYIIHGAGMGDPKGIMDDPVGVMLSNLNGLNRLLDLSKTPTSEGEKRRILFVSSSEVYGKVDGVNGYYKEEQLGTIDNLNPRSCYPMAKKAGETLCVSYALEYGADVVIARPCHTYGPYFSKHDNRVYAQFLRNVLDDEDIVMKSTGEQFRSWCYVVDCVSALLYILLKGKNCEAYNIADDTSNVRIRELADMIALIGGKKVVVELPNAIERKGFGVIKKAIFSNKKLSDLGWHNKTSIFDGLRKTICEIRNSESGNK